MARLFPRPFGRLLERIDRGLLAGRIALTLPDGTKRILGGRVEGPEAIVRLNSRRALARLAASGSVGWYRAWAKGEWQSPDPVPLFELFTRNAESLGETGRAKGPWKTVRRLAHKLRSNAPARARRNIEHHYDLGNDFYAAWLDRSLTYSSAIFETLPGEEPLEAAQARKLGRLLDRVKLTPGGRLLDIGSGWGSLAEIAAGERKLEVTGITLSPEQKAFAEGRLARVGLAGSARFRLLDYRDLEERFDGIISVEMAEAVGREYWPAYLRAIAGALEPGGRAALQMIVMRDALFESYAANADFIQTYIFPGGLLVRESEFERLANKAGLEWRDREAFGLHYAETLRRWRERFEAAIAEDRLPPGFDRKFQSLWRYYLMYCEGGFLGGALDVIQVTLVKR